MKEKSIHIIKKLKEAGHKAYWCGGVCRDYAMGLDPKDYDIATSATPNQIKELFDRVLEVGVSFGVSTVILGEEQFQVATFRKDGAYSDSRRPDTVELTSDLKEDAARRDFTINSMFYDPVEDIFIDYFGGMRDLKYRVIRAVGDVDDRIGEDSLRMLRAIRFSAQLGFHLDPELIDAIRIHCEDISLVSSERVRDELFKIFASKKPTFGINRLEVTGLLEIILPEVSRLIGCDQDPIHHPEGDVWTHSLGVVKTLKILNASPLLIFAGLLHDIGKPKTQRRWLDDEGRKRISNLGHAEIGAEMAESICKQLKMPTKDTDKVVNLVKLHMKAHLAKEMKKVTLIKFLRELEEKEILEEQILLQFADGKNSGHEEKPLLVFYREQILKLKPKIDASPLISGQDLIDNLKLSPGPIFRLILDSVRVAQDEGLITSKEAALEFVVNNHLT